MIKWIVFVICCIVCAVFYRLGGTYKKTYFRRFLTPVVMSVAGFVLFGLGETWWIGVSCYFVSAVLSGLNYSTYHRWLSKLLGHESRKLKWYNWAFQALVSSLVSLPFLLLGLTWYAMVIRTVVLVLTTTAWCELVKEPNLSEGGRGFLLCGTLPLLLI